MIYYTSDGRIVKYIKNKQDRISYGIQGVVYHFKNDECIKLYYNDCESRISKDMFLLYKELNLDNYCKLYDLLFNDKNIIIGYIMKYYQSSKENILFMPTEYTIDNVFRLYNSLTILANNGVLARDLHCGNAIVGDSEITIIDIDYCKKNMLKENKNILIKNIANLIDLILGLYLDGLKKICIDIDVSFENNFDYELFKNRLLDLFYLDDELEFPKVLSKKLSFYQRPIDLLYKKILTRN